MEWNNAKYFVLPPNQEWDAWFVVTTDANGQIVIIAKFWASRYANAACTAFNAENL